jgi:hypothetical protein
MPAKHSWQFKSRVSSTGLATFRAIVRKCPGRDPKGILVDLAASIGDPGRCFAAAKTAGFLDLALKFANEGRTDPRTLMRAARDLREKDARFSFRAGRLAIERILEGYGYELTAAHAIDACNHFMAAAAALGIAAQARAEVTLAQNRERYSAMLSFACARSTDRSLTVAARMPQLSREVDRCG